MRSTYTAQTINNTAAALKSQIEQEIRQYQTEVVPVGENPDYSQAKLVKRISIFESKTYPTGKFDKQGNYKHWFDIITPRIDSEVKNVDFDTSNVTAYSPRKIDELPCIITNLKNREYLRETGQAEEINSAIEEGAGYGNIVWKKIKGGYERVDLKNFYVINQTAFSLKESPVIERHQFIQSDLRAKDGVWQNVSDVIKQCKSNSYKTTLETQSTDTTTPYYEIFERNGEVCIKDLKEVWGQEPAAGDEDRYTFAKVIAAGSKSEGASNSIDIKYILFAEELTGKDNSRLYKEYHRGRYKGRWWREGLYELLFDPQVRGNQIGNQLSIGLEFAGKLLLASPDKLVIQNAIMDLKSGDILKATDLKQVDLRMHAADQLIAEWNRNIEHANEIANSREIVSGDTLPSGTPLGLGQLYNQNANKLFELIREKLAIPFSEMFEEWIIPEHIKSIKAEDVLRLTGDADMLKRLYEIVVEDWYIRNLVALGPHTNDVAQTIKAEKMAELAKRPQLLMKGVRALFEGFKPHVQVIITGEQLNLNAELQTLAEFVKLEPDPIRRTALVELMMKKKGIDAGSLPKSPPPPPPQAQISPMQPRPQAQPTQ